MRFEAINSDQISQVLQNVAHISRCGDLFKHTAEEHQKKQDAR